MLAVSVRNSILWALLLLLAGNSCAALMYEIVWLQLLQLVIGSSAVSLGLLLAAYMGGLCLGSGAMPRPVSCQRNPLSWTLVSCQSNIRHARPGHAWSRGGGIPASAHHTHGRLIPRCRAMGGIDTEGGVLVGSAV